MKIEPVYTKLGVRVATLREMLGYTQEELAARMSVGRSQLASIETGRCRIHLHLLEEIAKAVGTTPDRLMHGLWIGGRK